MGQPFLDMQYYDNKGRALVLDLEDTVSCIGTRVWDQIFGKRDPGRQTVFTGILYTNKTLLFSDLSKVGKEHEGYRDIYHQQEILYKNIIFSEGMN